MNTTASTLISRAEMLARLGLKSPRALERLVREGLIPPPIRLNERLLRWPANALDGLLARRKPNATPTEATPEV